MNIWLRNSSGHPDALLTLAALSVLVVLFKVIVAGVTFTLGTKTFNLGVIPTSDIIGALLAPTLGAYVMRKYSADKFSSPQTPLTTSTSTTTAVTTAKVENTTTSPSTTPELPLHPGV